jgi:hypothetical protein
MAVDYTKFFTIIGSYIDKVNDYSTLYDTFTEDKADIDNLLAGEDLVRLGDGLTSSYSSFSQNVASWLNTLVNRVSTIITDDELIGQNFSFGSLPALNTALPAIIADMTDNGVSVDNSTATIDTIEYDTHNTLVGYLFVGDVLDGVTAPISGAMAVPEYSGLTTQMTPDSETLTFTCISDSETGGIQGSESFSITGTQAGSGPFSPGGENVGQIGNITVCDAVASQYIANSSFDFWTLGDPDSWTLTDGAAGVDFDESANVLYGTGSSLLTIQVNGGLDIRQTLDSNRFIRNKAYFLSGFARKVLTAEGDQTILLKVSDDSGTIGSVTLQPTGSTVWQFFANQIIIPVQIDGDLVISLYSASLASGNDAIEIDNISLVPCEYISGVALAIFGGEEKFLKGDTITLPLSNDSDGKFQAFFRKAYKVQLPTSGSPTISESLIV